MVKCPVGRARNRSNATRVKRNIDREENRPRIGRGTFLLLFQ